MKQASFAEVIIDMTHLQWDVGNASIGAGGMLPKCIEDVDGIFYHYKMSSYTATQGIYGKEAILEVVFSRLGKLLGFNVLDYDLLHCNIEKDGVVYPAYISKSADFKRLNYKSIAIENYYTLHKYRNSDIEQLLREDMLLEDIHEIFLFDYIICNLDRHGANIEILINTTTGAKSVAPIFDNSLSFLTHRSVEDVLAKKYYDEAIKVNHYIGEGNLLSHLKKIDKSLIDDLPMLKENDRDVLFAGMHSALSEEYRAYLFDFIQRRIVDAKNI